MKIIDKKQIKYGAIISYSLIGINILLGLIYTPWVLKEVGDSSYGLYTLASSFIALFLMDFGMSAAVSRFLSNYRAENDQDGINEFVGLAIKFYLVVCCTITIILGIVYFNLGTIYKSLTPVEVETYKVVYVMTGFFVVICFPVNICNGILNAYEEFIWLKSLDMINKLGTVVITVVALLLHGGLFALIFINGFTNLLTFIVKVLVVRHKTPVVVKIKRTGRVSFKEIYTFSFWSTINGLSQQMVFNIIPSVLASIANTFAIVIYGFANTIEGYVYTITQGINGLFLPSVSREVVNKKDASDVLPLMIKVGRINQSIITLLLIGLAVLGKDFVNLWVGEKYNSLYICMLLLSFPYFISSSQQIANTSIIVLNKIKYLAIIGITTGIINIVASYYLCKKYGIIGVCSSICGLFVIKIICNNIVYSKVLKIDILTFFKKCQVQMIPAIVVSICLSILFVKTTPSISNGLMGWTLFVGKSIVLTIIYIIVMWFLAWNEDEKQLMKSLVLWIKSPAV